MTSQKQLASTQDGVRETQGVNNTDASDTYNYEDEQNNELNQILGGLELIVKGIAAGAGLDPQKVQDALNDAKNGDFTALQNLINDPNTNQQLKDVLDAYLKAAQLVQDGQKAGPLDDKKVKDLEDALKKFPPGPVTDSLLNTLDDVKKWNDIIKKTNPQDPGVPGQGDLGVAEGIIAVIQQALVAAGYGNGYGAVPDYGYAYGSYPEPAVPPAPIYPEPPLPMVSSATASLIVSNPAENGVTMPFLLNSETTQLPTGQYLELPTDRAWEIKFDHGEGFGVAHYSLQSGKYEFTHTSHGWELYRKTDAE